VIELLGQPDLADPEFLGASGLGDHIIDEIDGLRLGYNVIPLGIT
jgi:hypothetical protein